MIRKITIILAVGCLLTPMAMGDVWQDLAKYEYGDKSNAAAETHKLLQDTPVAQHAAIETKLIALVSSKDSTVAGKAFACRFLQQIGTEKCIPAVSGLLNHETLSHYARLSLEMIDSPKASAALLAAMPKTTEKIKCGIIMSLGNRRESKAVKAIAASLGGKETASAAMRSLAMIGGKEAAECLASAKAPEALRAVHQESLIVCAESLDKADAAKVCSKVLNDTKNSEVTRVAALRGLIKADGKKAAPIVVALIKGKPSYMKQGALRLTATEKCPPLTGAVADALGAMPAACQIQVLAVLGQRGDTAAMKAVTTLFASKSVDVKLAAYRAAGQMGSADCVKSLAVLANSDDAAVAQKAVAILGIIDNDSVNPALAGMIADPKLGPGAINALKRRGCTSVAAELIKLIQNANTESKIAAWGAMANLASDKDLDALMKQIVTIKEDNVRASAMNTIKALCTNSPDRRKCFDAIGPYYGKADKKLKILIVGLGSTTGGVKAIALAKEALKSPDAEITAASLRALMEWRDAGAADTLLDIAKTAPNAKDKLLALRGYIQVTGKQDERRRVSMYRKAAPLAIRPDEKYMIISGLRNIRRLEALKMLEEYLADEKVKPTAEQAVVDLSQRVYRDNKCKALAMKLVKSIADTSKNKNTVNRAKKLYKEMGGK